jgi:hypothetical protein
MKSVFLTVAALSAALLGSQALAQVAPPAVVTPLQTGTVTGGTSQTVTPKLDADKPQEKAAKPEDKPATTK